MEFTGFWYYFWFYFPLGIIGVWRWSTWLFKVACSTRYKPIPVQEHSPGELTLSLIIPVYDEDPALLENAVESWAANNPDEIIAVIDRQDKPCIQVFRRFREKNAKARLIVTSTPGKREALAEGIRVARSEIVALVDSDVVWAPDIKASILAPFRHPEIGGVVTRQNALECHTLWQRLTDIMWDLRNTYEWPSQIAMGRVVTVLSGRTALYRREILLPKLDQFLHEILFGRRKESGDDKCLTRLIQRDGWKTYYQSSAQIYSTAARNFLVFWKQRVRWSRNSYNSDFAAFLEGWVWKHPYLAFYMIDRFVAPFVLLLAPTAFALALYYNHWTVALVIGCWWMISRGIKLRTHFHRQPRDILILPAYVVINFATALARIYALFTLRGQKWIRSRK